MGRKDLSWSCLLSLKLSHQHWCSSRCCLQVSVRLDRSTLSTRGWKPQRESCCSDWGWGKAWQAHTLVKQRCIHWRLEGGRRNFSVVQGQDCWRCFRAAPIIHCLSCIAHKLLCQLQDTGPLLPIDLSWLSFCPLPPTSLLKKKIDSIFTYFE